MNPSFFYIQTTCFAIGAVGYFIVRIIFALAVLSDVVTIQDKGQKVVFVSGKMWAWAVFFGGILMAIAYWVIHHSTLRSHSESEQIPQPVPSEPVPDVRPRGPIHDY